MQIRLRLDIEAALDNHACEERKTSRDRDPVYFNQFQRLYCIGYRYTCVAWKAVVLSKYPTRTNVICYL